MFPPQTGRALQLRGTRMIWVPFHSDFCMTIYRELVVGTVLVAQLFLLSTYFRNTTKNAHIVKLHDDLDAVIPKVGATIWRLIFGWSTVVFARYPSPGR